MPFNISDHINSTNFGVYDSPSEFGSSYRPGVETISHRPYVERTYETYDRYLKLREACGYDVDHGAMTLEVWGNCDWDAQDSMIAQYQAGADKIEAERLAAESDVTATRYRALHGDVW